MPVLTPAQRKAHDAVLESFSEKAVTLLHGVTGSGKTEIYIHLIRRTLDYGRCVLFLVPEIALTTQLTTRLQKVFGEKVLIYHSKFSDNERVEMWRRVLASREPLVVVGARSAVFLPFRSLGLVIVDEEHESSYKQYSRSALQRPRLRRDACLDVRRQDPLRQRHPVDRNLLQGPRGASASSSSSNATTAWPSRLSKSST